MTTATISFRAHGIDSKETAQQVVKAWKKSIETDPAASNAVCSDSSGLRNTHALAATVAVADITAADQVLRRGIHATGCAYDTVRVTLI